MFLFHEVFITAFWNLDKLNVIPEALCHCFRFGVVVGLDRFAFHHVIMFRVTRHVSVPFLQLRFVFFWLLFWFHFLPLFLPFLRDCPASLVSPVLVYFYLFFIYKCNVVLDEGRSFGVSFFQQISRDLKNQSQGALNLSWRHAAV